MKFISIDFNWRHLIILCLWMHPRSKTWSTFYRVMPNQFSMWLFKKIFSPSTTPQQEGVCMTRSAPLQVLRLQIAKHNITAIDDILYFFSHFQPIPWKETETNNELILLTLRRILCSQSIIKLTARCQRKSNLLTYCISILITSSLMMPLVKG